MNEHPKYYITYMKFHADAIHDSATVIHKEKMMNERIRELYYECQDESQSTEQCYQKFAELIVRECAKRVDYWESKQGEHCEDLLKHFGVTV
jgi:hypothetical protein